MIYFEVRRLKKNSTQNDKINMKCHLLTSI